MTAYQLSNVSRFIESLNTLFNDAVLYDLTINLSGPVANGDGQVLGRVVWQPDDEVYVFVPGPWETYPE